MSESTRSRIILPKPGNRTTDKRAHRVIALLDSLDKLVEKTAAHLIANQLERGRKVHEGLYGYRRRPPCIDAVAVLISDTHRAWSRKRIAGVLLMDVKSAFNSVSQSIACYSWKWKRPRKWTECFMSERKARLQEGTDHEVSTGIPQGSPASPILFTIYLSGLFGWKTKPCRQDNIHCIQCRAVGGRRA